MGCLYFILNTSNTLPVHQEFCSVRFTPSISGHFEPLKYHTLYPRRPNQERLFWNSANENCLSQLPQYPYASLMWLLFSASFFLIVEVSFFVFFCLHIILDRYLLNSVVYINTMSIIVLVWFAPNTNVHVRKNAINMFMFWLANWSFLVIELLVWKLLTLQVM